MQDVHRIPFLLNLPGQCWKNHPEQKFFQIISMIHQNIPAKMLDDFHLEDDEPMPILQKTCQSEDKETSPTMYTLYSDAEVLAYHSRIKTEGNTEYVDVYVDNAKYFDDNTGRNESVSFTFRLPQRKIVKFDRHTSPYFVHSDWEKEGIREIIWRILDDEDIILQLARTATSQYHSENEMNFLRNKICGHIARRLLSECPHCHIMLDDAMAEYVCTIPVSFYMHSGNFGLFEGELYQSVVDAVYAGDVTGKCQYCHEVLTTTEINAVKDGWQYPWRYSRQYPWQYHRKCELPVNHVYEKVDYSTIMPPIVKINDNVKIIWCDDDLHTSDDSDYDGSSWNCLYCDEDNTAYFTALRSEQGQKFTDVKIDNVCYRNFQDQSIEFIQLVLRLPNWEIREVQYPSDPNFCIDDIDCDEVANSLKRLYADQAVILELARRTAMDNCTEDNLNALRDKIKGKIVRRMPTTCPYCHESMTGEMVNFTVNIPVKFYMTKGTICINKNEAYQEVVEVVQKGNVTGECLRCHHLLTAEDINYVKDGWQYRWRYDPHK